MNRIVQDTWVARINLPLRGSYNEIYKKSRGQNQKRGLGIEHLDREAEPPRETESSGGSDI